MKDNRDVLLIDDDETSNLINEIILKKSRIFNSIKSVVTAEKGLEYLISAENKLPDIIFLDINMPEMNGWEFLEKYSDLSSEIVDKVEVYMLSSSINPDDLIKAAKHPKVKDFLNKPLRMELLHKKFQEEE